MLIHVTVRDTIGTGIYFMTYESGKQMLANARGNSPTSPLAVVMAGGLCGLVSWACVCADDPSLLIVHALRNHLLRSLELVTLVIPSQSCSWDGS